ncbi:MAG: hypothetical protein KME17_06925 [Cyanosarcina radialis HA8281-LM2]|jgi:hypothetical protein|nr:hypothetical protein [Cyanosarcina radialis HA8281-LM2]
MTKQNDDDRLIEFLRQHRPSVPPVAPDLEDQILQAVAASDVKHPRRRLLWVLPPAIAAGALIAWVGYQILSPPQVPKIAVDPASVEAFLEDNWNAAIGETPEVTPSGPNGSDWLLEASNE